MFLTTRIYICFFNGVGYSLETSYFIGVWMAGITSFAYIIAQEAWIDQYNKEGNAI